MAHLKILLIRHAQSVGNRQGQMEGQRSTALSKLGHAQAQQLTTYLLTQNLPTHIYSSPLLRARQTIQPAIAALQQSSHRFHSQPTTALQELHQGIFQGLTWAEAQSKYPKICTQLLSSLTWQLVPQAESLVDARARARSWMKHILSQHKPGDVVWAVSHEGFLQQLISVIMGCDRTWKISIPQTALFEFWLASTQYQNQWQQLKDDRFNPEFWLLKRFNDCSHLTADPNHSAPDNSPDNAPTS